MPDPRMGLPSASSVGRYFACNRSYLLEQLVPEKERFSTKDAEIGDRIHRSNETGDLSILESFSEEDMVRAIRAREERIYNQWVSDNGIVDGEIIREQRLWLTKDGVRLVSAKIDFFALSEKKKLALVIDAKSGRKAVAPPVKNHQLRTAVVILAANFALVGARVAIVQPLAESQPQAEYSTEQIFEAWDQLEKLLVAIKNPNAKAVTGDHCSFCNARHICPSAKDLVFQVEKLSGLKWSLLPNAEKVKLWDAWKQVQTIGKHIEENIKADVVANPEAFKDWLIKKPNSSVREIADLTAVYGKLASEIQFTPEEFTALCSMSVGDLVTFVRQKTGKSEKEANAFVNDRLRDCITKKERQGSIERVKDK